MVGLRGERVVIDESGCTKQNTSVAVCATERSTPMMLLTDSLFFSFSSPAKHEPQGVRNSNEEGRRKELTGVELLDQLLNF
jgi:hypothetical protein